MATTHLYDGGMSRYSDYHDTPIHLRDYPDPAGPMLCLTYTCNGCGQSYEDEYDNADNVLMIGNDHQGADCGDCGGEYWAVYNEGDEDE